MTDAQVMRGYRFHVRELSLLQAQMRQLEAALSPAGLRGQHSLEEYRATNELQAALLQQLDCLEQQLLQRQRELLELVKRQQAILQRVEDPRLRTILHMYYVLGLHDHKIAEKLGVSSRLVNNLRNQWVHQQREE